MSCLRMGIVAEIPVDKQNLNRIKVKLPDIAGGQTVLEDVLVLTDCAGDKWGKVVVPNVGDAVIVGFTGDNMEGPVVLGSVPSAKTIPPYKIAAAGSNDVQYCQFKSGTAIVLTEKKDSSDIKITTKNGHVVNIKDSSGGQIAEITSKDKKTSLKIDLKKSSIQINAQNIALKANDLISMKAGNVSLGLKSGQGVTLKSPSGKFSASVNNVSISANAGATLKSKAAVTVQGSITNLKANGIIQVKGGMAKIN